MNVEDIEKMYKLDKTGKIVKKEAKLNFNELKAGDIHGDEIYEAEKSRLREKKAQKKE